MKKIAIILLVMMSLVLFTACDDTPESGTTQTFIGGTTGLSISFMPDFPPANVLDGGEEPFTVNVKLENEGETDVAKDDILVKLRGIYPEDFDVTLADLSKHPDEDLLGNEINPDTGQIIPSYEVYVEFDNLNYVGSLVGGGHVFDMVADVCYMYSTKATAELCVKEDLRDTTDTHVCTISGNRKLTTSGAPVQITSFDEFTSGKDEVAFTFTVKDMLSGELSRKGTQCNDSLTHENRIWVEVDTDLPGELDCIGLQEVTRTDTVLGGYLKLSGGERNVRCTQEILQKVDYVKIVNLELVYDYQESQQTSIRVVHSGLDEE